MMNIVTSVDTTEIENRIAEKVCAMLLAANPPPTQTCDLLTVKEAMATLRVARGTLYKFIKEGKVKTLKIGNKRFVSKIDIQNFLNKVKQQEYE